MRQLVSTLVAVALAGIVAVPAFGRATTEGQRLLVPFSTTVGDNPCTGEAVAVQGELLVVTRTTEDASGGFHATIVLVPHGVTAVGLLTGTTYTYAAATHSSFTSSGPPQNEVTDTFTTVVAGVDGGGNLVIRGVFHETVAANGEITAFVDRIAATCVG